MLALPFEPPKQLIFVDTAVALTFVAGCVIVATDEVVDEFALRIVTVYVPAANQ